MTSSIPYPNEFNASMMLLVGINLSLTAWNTMDSLGVFAWKTHGLEAGSAYHSVNNLISFYLVAFGFDTISSTVALPDFAADMALTIISAALLYYIGTKNGWFEEKTSESKLI
ncbi:MAG: hypothetical protein Q4Q55_09685 [Methanobrevibacter sp.]|nr:hypothetical protein [Methanobrevibacter sp.]